MHYLALCCDYDGTLAHDGVIDDSTIAAIEKVKRSGRKLLMVTGRELRDLFQICPRLDLFDYVVAENGGLLYVPESRETKPLGKQPPPEFIELLRARGVQPFSVGEVIVATWEPHQQTVLDCIRDLGLELQVIFNKGAVMVLPAGINKASGLAAALSALQLSPHNAVGIGDAENDHAFLAACECAVAVANALPALKDVADFVTRGDHGMGVVELAEELLADDLASRIPQLRRHHVLFGHDAAGAAIKIAPQGVNALLLGTSGSGKSTVATGLIERLHEQGYSYCIIDPEGDYGTIESAVSVGTPARPPSIEELLTFVDDPATNVVVNMIGVPFDDRPTYFVSLLTRLQELRAQTGRPHWIVLDEAHHLMPPQRESHGLTVPEGLTGLIQITVHANLMAPSALKSVNTVIVVGSEPAKMLAEFASVRGLTVPTADKAPLQTGEAFIWQLAVPERITRVHVAESHTERRRHVRKYTEGELPEDRSFYFRGRDNKLNLRAQNLILFLQLGDGVDDETWMHHSNAHDFSTWMRTSIRDEELAEEVASIEDRNLDPQEGRKHLREAIEARYTLPAA